MFSNIRFSCHLKHAYIFLWKLSFQDGIVKIWRKEVSSGGVGVYYQSNELYQFPDVVWHVSWSFTGNILAVSGGDNEVINKVISNGFQNGSFHVCISSANCYSQIVFIYCSDSKMDDRKLE